MMSCPAAPGPRALSDLLLGHRRADVAGDVQVIPFRFDAVHRDALGVAVFFLPELVGNYDFLMCSSFSTFWRLPLSKCSEALMKSTTSGYFVFVDGAPAGNRTRI